MTASAIYEGHVRHRRFRPHPHDFRYRIAQLLIDLDELPSLFAGRWFWSVERANLVSFRRSDYLGDPAIPLKQAVLDRVEAATGTRPGGAVRMLAHLRMFGLCFNPVVFYYCHTADGTLAAIVAEITNTPWDERHAYVLPVPTADHHGRAGRVLGWRFDKRFHVSPFLPMGLRYDWRFDPPGEALRVHMDVANGEGTLFDATLSMQKKHIDARSLSLFLCRHPFSTLAVVARIYWNAALIRLKRNPFYPHPKSS